MDYQNYNDYMRNLLGYPNRNCPDMCMNNQTPYQNIYQPNDDLEGMYPDTYRIIYPMVVSVCNMVNVDIPITESMINRMTDDIYDRAEADSRIMVDINTEVENREENDSRQISEDSMQRRPRRRNRFLRDFIRVLLLRELLGRRRGFLFRPF